MTTQEIDERINQLTNDLNDIDKKLDSIVDEIIALNAKVHAGRWTEEDVEFTKSMKKLYPNACQVQRSVNGKDVAVFSKDRTMLLEMHGNPFCFPHLEPGEPVEVDEIIGGAE